MSESTLRAFDLIAYLSRTAGKAAQGVSLAHIASETGLNKATALRYLCALESRGVVERRPQGWSLGLTLIDLASRVPVESITVDRVRPFLEKLAQDSHEMTSLSCISDASAVFLDQVRPRKDFFVRFATGDKLPLHCTAMGKAILSILPEDKARAILGFAPLSLPHSRKLIEPEQVLRAAVADRTRGYSIDDGEFEEGCMSVARPIKLPGNNLAGALAISGPSERMRTQISKGSLLDQLSRAASATRTVLETGTQWD